MHGSSPLWFAIKTQTISTEIELFMNAKSADQQWAEISEVMFLLSILIPSLSISSPSTADSSSELNPSTPESHVQPDRVNTPPRRPLDVDLTIAAQADTKIFFHQVCLLKVPDDTTPHVFVVDTSATMVAQSVRSTNSPIPSLALASVALTTHSFTPSPNSFLWM